MVAACRVIKFQLGKDVKNIHISKSKCLIIIIIIIIIIIKIMIIIIIQCIKRRYLVLSCLHVRLARQQHLQAIYDKQDDLLNSFFWGGDVPLSSSYSVCITNYYLC